MARVTLMGAGGRQWWKAALCAGATLGTTACGAPARDEEIRAVILIDIDTLRADGLSIYGNPRTTSPALDAFARQGTRFEWAFSQAPYTLPSQASIMTSLYPWSHGVLHEGDRIAARARTLAEEMRDAGFATGAFVDGGFLKATFGFDQGFDQFVDLDGGGLARGEPEIAEWVKRNAGRRFFLFVHTYDVHTPYAPPEPFRSRFAALAPAPSPGFEPTSDALEALRASQWTAEPRRLPPNDLAYARAMYDAEVAYVDAWFGRFMALLEQLGLADRSVVSVISDHGEEFQEHGSVLHEKLYSTVTRVPWLIRTPTGMAGQLIENAVESIDLAPTLLDLVGAPIPVGFQGRSLSSAIRTGSRLPGRPAVSYSPFYGEQRAVADGEWRLLLTVKPIRFELFRFRIDPLETVDRADEQPQMVRVLGRELGSRIAETMSKGVADSSELSLEVVEQLRALGYLR